MCVNLLNKDKISVIKSIKKYIWFHIYLYKNIYDVYIYVCIHILYIRKVKIFKRHK